MCQRADEPKMCHPGAGAPVPYCPCVRARLQSPSSRQLAFSTTAHSFLMWLLPHGFTDQASNVKPWVRLHPGWPHLQRDPSGLSSLGCHAGHGAVHTGVWCPWLCPLRACALHGCAVHSRLPSPRLTWWYLLLNLIFKCRVLRAQ